MLLVEKGRGGRFEGRNGWTPLHVAAVWGTRDVATVLLANGADVNARADGASMPLRITESSSRCHKDVSALLKKKGVDAERGGERNDAAGRRDPERTERHGRTSEEARGQGMTETGFRDDRPRGFELPD